LRLLLRADANRRADLHRPRHLVVADPARDPDGGAEQNLLHFTLQTDQQAATGAWSVTTGLVATTPDTARHLAVQYWTETYDPSTGHLAATLTEDHVEEALAYNLVGIEQLIVPCQPQVGTIPTVAAMGEGSRPAGTLDPPRDRSASTVPRPTSSRSSTSPPTSRALPEATHGPDRAVDVSSDDAGRGGESVQPKRQQHQLVIAAAVDGQLANQICSTTRSSWTATRGEHNPYDKHGDLTTSLALK
jgi:hypothetical protein